MPNTDSFPIIFVVLGIVIAIAFVTVIALVIRNARRVRQSGHNPFTLQADLATRLMDSDVLSSRRPVAERLRELDALRDQGSISDAEHSTARAEVLRTG